LVVDVPCSRITELVVEFDGQPVLPADASKGLRGWDTMALPEEQQWSDEKKSAVLAAIKDI
jgi:hypothetical protein